MTAAPHRRNFRFKPSAARHHPTTLRRTLDFIGDREVTAGECAIRFGRLKVRVVDELEALVNAGSLERVPGCPVGAEKWRKAPGSDG